MGEGCCSFQSWFLLLRPRPLGGQQERGAEEDQCCTPSIHTVQLEIARLLNSLEQGGGWSEKKTISFSKISVLNEKHSSVSLVWHNLVFAFRPIKRIPSSHSHLHRGLPELNMPLCVSCSPSRACSWAACRLPFKNEFLIVPALYCPGGTFNSHRGQTVLLQCLLCSAEPLSPVVPWAEQGCQDLSLPFTL